MAAEERKSLAEFDQELAKVHMRGQWQYDELLVKAIGGPRPAGIPFIWKWETVRPKLDESCEVLQESYTARRNMSFLNPGLERGGTTHTILMGMQIVKPGELAWAHRHTLSAIRFVIQGHEKLYTVVDGEVCPMQDHDLVLTPRWCWHDHHNESGGRAIWLDVLDVPFCLGLNQAFYEPFPGDRQQPRRPDEGEYIGTRAGALRPTWEAPQREFLPLRYPWREVEAQLKRLARQEGSPYDGVALEYVNPVTGGPTLPTLSCWIQMLRPGEATKRHRHTSSAVYYVVRGEGRTIVGDTELEWGPGDAFCVPNWAWHEHANRSRSEEAILFSANDVPILKPFGLYREEPEESLWVRPAPAIPAIRPAKGG